MNLPLLQQLFIARAKHLFKNLFKNLRVLLFIDLKQLKHFKHLKQPKHRLPALRKIPITKFMKNLSQDQLFTDLNIDLSYLQVPPVLVLTRVIQTRTIRYMSRTLLHQ